MNYWLIIYDRAARQLLECREYANSHRPLTERFAVERLRPDLEVVVLGADSLDTIKRTHSRYFTGETFALSTTQT